MAPPHGAKAGMNLVCTEPQTHQEDPAQVKVWPTWEIVDIGCKLQLRKVNCWTMKTLAFNLKQSERYGFRNDLLYSIINLDFICKKIDTPKVSFQPDVQKQSTLEGCLRSPWYLFLHLFDVCIYVQILTVWIFILTWHSIWHLIRHVFWYSFWGKTCFQPLKCFWT